MVCQQSKPEPAVDARASSRSQSQRPKPEPAVEARGQRSPARAIVATLKRAALLTVASRRQAEPATVADAPP